MYCTERCLMELEVFENLLKHVHVLAWYTCTISENAVQTCTVLVSPLLLKNYFYDLNTDTYPWNDDPGDHQVCVLIPKKELSKVVLCQFNHKNATNVKKLLPKMQKLNLHVL